MEELAEEKDVHVLLSRVETCTPPVNGARSGDPSIRLVVATDSQNAALLHLHEMRSSTE